MDSDNNGDLHEEHDPNVDLPQEGEPNEELRQEGDHNGELHEEDDHNVDLHEENNDNDPNRISDEEFPGVGVFDDDDPDRSSSLSDNHFENDMPFIIDSDVEYGDVAMGHEDEDMSDGIRIAERLADTVEASSSSSSAYSVGEIVNHASEPVRSFVEHVVRRVTDGEAGITDGVLARLRRMVFRLDGHLQRRGLLINSEGPASQSRSSNGTNNGSQNEEQAEQDGPPPEDAVSFDTNLPAEHSYMGSNMSRVPGINYFENGKKYNIRLFKHQNILFPGEILPFMISGNIFDDEEQDTTNGMIFGICFPFLTPDENSKHVYGVTCHIYEKGTDEFGNLLVKSRALQRFVMQKEAFNGPLQFIASHPRFKCCGLVKILPEIFLPDPLRNINMGSMYRFRDDKSTRHLYKRYQVASTPLPSHVFDQYSIEGILEKARTKLAKHKIDNMPADIVQLSFWLVRNLHLSEDLAKSIFETDSVNIRMKLIASSFKEDSIFVCRYCGNCIAESRELFAMSKYGVQTQYCNSAGYIHDTNTVYRLLHDAVSFSGSPSTEFSWFPGYQWHIINCQVCTRHIGWQFKAVEPNLVPNAFYGISSSSVKISTQPELDAQADMYRGLVRLARRHME